MNTFGLSWRRLALHASLAFMPLSFVAGGELLHDGDFELSQPNGQFPNSGFWQASHLDQGGAACTQTAGRTGNGLWAFTGSAAELNWWTQPYQECAALAGEAFRGSAAIRTPREAPWVPGSRACVHIAFLDSNHRILASYESVGLEEASDEWRVLTVVTEAAPLGTALVRYSCWVDKPQHTTGQTVATFDDCSLVSVSAPAAAISTHHLGLRPSESLKELQIVNPGNAPLTWEARSASPWLTILPKQGTLPAQQSASVTVGVDRSLLSPTGTVRGSVTITTDAVDLHISVFVANRPISVPPLPSLVQCYGRQLRVQDRLPDGRLSAPYHYVIKGVAWSPASRGTIDDPIPRRAAFKDWYVADVQLMKAMNVNTVYTFFDFGTNDLGQEILDYLYANDIKAIVTVDNNGSADITRLHQVIPAYRNHPAVLAWAVGNEWNINLYHNVEPGQGYSEAEYRAAIELTEDLAQEVKTLDSLHPVASIFGDFDASDAELAMTNIVNHFCPSVDFWGINVYRGSTFGPLFQDWARITPKPVFFSEYGTDAFRSVGWTIEDWSVVSVDGRVDERMQADFNRGLWTEIEANLSARRITNVCVGGTVFAWNDEWWKAGSPTGIRTDSFGVHDLLGFYTWWNPAAMPDSIANEEWFALLSIDRRPRLSYDYFQEDFAEVIVPSDLDGDTLPDHWEYTLVDHDPDDAYRSLSDILPEDDWDDDGVTNEAEFRVGSDATDPASFAQLTELERHPQAVRIAWHAGTTTVVRLERTAHLGPPIHWQVAERQAGSGEHLEPTHAMSAAAFFRLQVEQ